MAANLKNFVFTINNPAEDCLEELKDKCQYLIWGEEVGMNGTPHFQGFAQLHKLTRFNTIKKMIPKAHIESMRGTAEQAAEYCKKEGKFHEYGELRRMGERSDIARCADMVLSMKRIREVAITEPTTYIKYHKGIEKLQKILIEPRNEKPEVKVFWGPTGVGKTKKAMDWLPDAYVWLPQNGQWFDGYEGQEEVILDEFRGQLPFGMILSLLDRYSCKVQFKGGMCEFRGLKIAITSPKPPLKWYDLEDDHDKSEQLLRRIDTSEQMG